MINLHHHFVIFNFLKYNLLVFHLGSFNESTFALPTTHFLVEQDYNKRKILGTKLILKNFKLNFLK